MPGSCTARVRVIRHDANRGLIRPWTTRVEGRMRPCHLAGEAFGRLLGRRLLALRRWRGRGAWPRARPVPWRAQRTRRPPAPPPFPGRTRTPACAACAPGGGAPPQAPGAPPPRLGGTRGRPQDLPRPASCSSPGPGAFAWRRSPPPRGRHESPRAGGVAEAVDRLGPADGWVGRHPWPRPSPLESPLTRARGRTRGPSTGARGDRPCRSLGRVRPAVAQDVLLSLVTGSQRSCPVWTSTSVSPT
jgi:hypothetical protein